MKTESPTTKAKHTPGPWTVNGRWKLQHCSAGVFVGARPPRTLAYVGPNPRFRTEQENAESIANANLMAAAPELLDALKAVTDELESRWLTDLDCVKQARAAIEKAEGAQ